MGEFDDLSRAPTGATTAAVPVAGASIADVNATLLTASSPSKQTLGSSSSPNNSITTTASASKKSIVVDPSAGMGDLKGFSAIPEEEEARFVSAKESVRESTIKGDVRGDLSKSTAEPSSPAEQ